MTKHHPDLSLLFHARSDPTRRAARRFGAVELGLRTPGKLDRFVTSR